MMETWLERERRTASLVRHCYFNFVQAREPTAGQLYALCKLTWITKGGAGPTDNTAATTAPALAAMMGVALLATTPSELSEELRTVGVPDVIVKLVARPVGFTNYYGGFRNIAKEWLADHRDDVWHLVRMAADPSPPSVRMAYQGLDSLPVLPRRGGGDGKPRNLLTPLFACLDERGRAPIINKRKEWLLKILGLARATTVEQYDGLVGLIGQAGIDDAFALDQSNEEEIEKAMRVAPGGSRRTRKSKSHPPKALGQRCDEDIESLRAADTVKMRRVHNSMTNALRAICEARGVELKEGSEQTCLFDALVRNYSATERHLLIEVKTDHSPAMCRMAIGQLFDYRRLHGDRAAMDLAILFPAKPSREALDFVAYLGVKALWFDESMRGITGDLLLRGSRSNKR